MMLSSGCRWRRISQIIEVPADSFLIISAVNGICGPGILVSEVTEMPKKNKML